MPFILADRIRETTAVAGTTNTVTLTGAVDGYRTVASAVAVADTWGYCIQHRTMAEWEIGVATQVSATTFTRAARYSNAGPNTPAAFSTGDKDVFLVALADSSFLKKTGDIISGQLGITADPTEATHAARKAYVDAGDAPKTRTVTGTADTPTSADIGGMVQCTSANPVTIIGQDLGAKGRYRVAQLGSGQVTVAAGTNVNLVSDKNPPSFASLGRGSILDVMTDGAGNVFVSGATAAAAPIVVSGSYSGTITLGAAPTAYQVLQRTTRTGGAFNKGLAPVTIGLTPTAPVATLEIRLRDADNTGTVLMDWTQAATSLPAGAQSVTLNIPATNKWLLMDLRPNGDTPKAISTYARFGCGEVMCLYGQDIILDGIIPTANDTSTTLTSLSITPSALGSVYAITSTAAGVLTNNPPGWAVPSASGTYKGALVAELLNRMIAGAGVCCGIIGMGKTAATAAILQGNATFSPTFAGIIASGTQCGKGIGSLVLGLGQDDAKAGTSAATFQTNLASLVSTIASAFPGFAFKTVIAGIASHTDTTYVPTAANITAIRQGLLNYVSGAANAAAIWPWDAALHTDGWRYTQAGNRTLARHVYRALANAFGIASDSDVGPTITSAARASGSADVVLTVAQASGTAFGTASGTTTSLFQVFPSGATTGALTVNNVTLTNATTITLTLSAAPADGQALDVYYHRPPDSALAAVAYIPDNDVADGIALGRLLSFTRTTPFTVAAPGSVAWAPSALGSALIFASDTNNTAKVPDDGSGKAQFMRHLYDDTKTLVSPIGFNRPGILTSDGASGTKRVLSLGYTKYLRANGADFASLTNMMNGTLASTNGTVIIACKLLADDGNWADVFRWADVTGDHWITLQQRGTHTNNAQGGTSFRLRDTTGNTVAPDNTDDTGWFVFSCIKSGTGITLRKNGTQVGTATYGGSQSLTGADFLINASLDTSGQIYTEFDGAVYTQAISGLLITNTALTSTNLTNAEAWVKATAGIV